MLQTSSIFSKTNPQERNAMKELKCSYGKCNATLSSIPEIATGICEKHRDLLERRHHYAVVCWHCGSIVLIENSPVQGGVKLISDKYIFTRTCPKCDQQSNGEKWMNNPRADELSEVVLGENLTLHPTAHGLVAGPQRSISHLNPRRTKATEVPDQKEDIIAKIKLRAEADERLQSFLDDIEYN